MGRRTAAWAALALVVGGLGLLPPGAVAQDAGVAAAATLPSGFADTKVIGNISEATAVAFAPDGTAFVALKTGVIKSFDYNSGTGQFEGNATSTNFADLTTPVENYWDRGLTGIAVDPQFGTTDHNYVYVNYTYNKDPRDGPNGVVPKWGTPGSAYDNCPKPATESDPTVAGCVVQDRVTRLTAVSGTNGWVMQPGSEKELMSGGCYQFGSHASGDVTFGPDGKLYASSGEGASFSTLDYGQYANPCGDPADEGGSLRAQDYRSGSDSLGVDGTVMRMDPATGFTPSQNTANTWLVAYGQRNPWRLTFRPKADGTGLTNELWSGDVGASAWEEINRIPDVTAVTTPVNRGWPCYEGSYTGSLRQPGWDALDKPLCESLYTQGTGAVAAPYFSYETRGPKLTPNEDCLNDTSSVSGIAFGSANSNYPAAYKGALFFSDYARSCIWVLGKKANGDPDPTTIQPFVQAAETPVDLVTGPGGDLYYVDYGLDANGVPTENAAGVHRIVYTPPTSNAAPTARIAADQTSGAAPLSVTFDGTGSTDPEGDPLTYSWDLDGDGTYGDSTAAKPTKTYGIGTYSVGLKVSDDHGHTSAPATVQVQAGNSAPTIDTMSPDATRLWSVGETVSFSGAASDAQETLPASAYTWNVAIRHCPGGVCHTHNLSTFSGVKSGSFQAPDHEYPSHLLLTLTVTDSGGLTATKTVQLDPRTVQLSFASTPTGATVTVNGADHTTPYAETFIQGSRVTVTAAATNGAATFSSWSDGGARSHELTAPTTPTAYTAAYNRAPVAQAAANPTSGQTPLAVSLTAAASTDPDGDPLTYAWDTDDDGQFDDATGVTASATYTSLGPHVARVRVTDNRGGSTTAAVTVTVTNSGPTARITTTPATPTGNAPFPVTFSAATSSDPDNQSLTYAWDLDGDGAFDDGTATTASRTYGVGTTTVKLRVTDSAGASSTAAVVVSVPNRAPVAQVTADPATGPAPLQVGLSAAGSTDPDGGALQYAWDLDGDGQFDDATGVTTSRTFTDVGPHPVTVRVTDPDAGTATATVTVTATNTAPTMARLTTYPTGGVYVGQTVGFDAAATDAQQLLTDAAYSFVLQRQDCATCPRVEVQRWDHVSVGQLRVPSVPATAHLFLVATAIDAQGAIGSAELRLDPQVVSLTVRSRPDRLRLGDTQLLVRGDTVRVSAPRSVRRRGDRWVFVRWSDRGARTHDVTVWDPSVRLTAVYRRKR